MSGSERKVTVTSLPSPASLLLALLVLVPCRCHAEPTILLHQLPVTSTESSAVIRRQMSVGLNESGDLVIRRSDLSLTLAYNPPPEILEPKERFKVAQKSELPTISGISVKVSFLF